MLAYTVLYTQQNIYNVSSLTHHTIVFTCKVLNTLIQAFFFTPRPDTPFKLSLIANAIHTTRATNTDAIPHEKPASPTNT